LTALHESEIVTKVSADRGFSVKTATTQDAVWTMIVRKSAHVARVVENDLATRTRFQRKVDTLGTSEAVLTSAKEDAPVLTSARLEQEGGGIISNPDATLTKVGL